MANVLTGSGRLGRLDSFLIQIGAGVGMAAGSFGTFLMFPATESASGALTIPPSAMPLLLMMSAVFSWVSYGTLVCRCHDRGHKGIFVMWLFVPVLGVIAALYLLLIPGESINNRYGRPPRDAKMAALAYQEQKLVVLNQQLTPTQAPVEPSYVNADGSYDMDGLFKSKS